MGLMLGVQPIFERFDPAYSPYRYRIQTQVALSAKWWDGRGVYIPVQMHSFRVNLPGLAGGGRLRLWVMAEYNRRNNAGYFGVGNASEWDSSPAAPPPGETVLARFVYSYSQDAISGGLPVGISVDIGHVF